MQKKYFELLFRKLLADVCQILSYQIDILTPFFKLFFSIKNKTSIGLNDTSPYLMWYSLIFYSCNHSKNFIIFSFNIFLVFWAFWSDYWAPSMNERQKLGRLEKLLGNFQTKKVFLQKVKNSSISFLLWILQSATRNTTVYKI